MKFDRIFSLCCDRPFSPSTATNQQNSVRNVVQLSQIPMMTISEAIQQASFNIEVNAPQSKLAIFRAKI